jgi:hypothetical protein
MKKLAILFLLTIVLASFTFAQVTVKGGFEVINVTGADETVPTAGTEADPVLYTEFSGAASKELGPGSIGVALQVGAGLHFGDDVDPYDPHGDLLLKGSYSLAAGPGTLAFALFTKSASFGALGIGVDYDGIAVGPATLGFGVEYDFNTSGRDGADVGAFKDDPKEGDKFIARAGFGIAGFSLTYKLEFTLNATNPANGDDESWVSKIAYIDASYQVLDPLKVGLELDNTGAPNKDGDYFKGFALKPYAEYAINASATVGASVFIGNISGEKPYEDIYITPGLWISYSF